MHISSVAVAFLRNQNKYLLMKRAKTKKHYPDVWDGVGGGVESCELSEPTNAILREIFEETGFESMHISNLTLRYLHINKHDSNLVNHYIFFADTDKTDFWQTDEGVLSWIIKDDFFNREFSPTMKALLEHYFTVGINTKDLYLFSTYEGKNSILPFDAENC